METLEDLFEDGLRDIYYAEKAILKSLPKMAKKAGHEELKEAFNEHVQMTNKQVQRLEQVFQMIGVKPRAKKCPAMDGLVAEAEEIMKEAEDEDVRDAGMLGCAQSVEHYEISRYGTLKAWAQRLGMDEAVQLLDETLQEEKETDSKLTMLAEQAINEEAKSKEAEEDEDEDQVQEDEDEPASRSQGRAEVRARGRHK
jgi:ferritin-like metal-binding protein YciE